MLTHIKGASLQYTDWVPLLNSHAIEASWRLGKWEEVASNLDATHQTRFEVALGEILLKARKNEFQQFADKIQFVRENLTVLLSAASMESYRRGYEYVLQLHMLQEIENVVGLIQYRVKNGLTEEFQRKVDLTIKTWDSRLRITSQSFKVTEPILNLRRLLLSDFCVAQSTPGSLKVLKKCQRECGRLWLQTAKISRKSGYSQNAYRALLHASASGTSFIHLEKAKWLWDKGQTHKALSELHSALADDASLSFIDESNVSQTDKLVKARVCYCHLIVFSCYGGVLT